MSFRALIRVKGVIKISRKNPANNITYVSKDPGKNSVKYTKGSITIETIIIVPFLFICVILVMYISIRLYRIVLTQVFADLASQRGAAVWDNINKDIDTGKPINTISKSDMPKVPLYWRLLDSQKDIKKDKIKGWLFSHLDKNLMLYNNEKSRTTVGIETKDYIIFKKIQIEIAYSYNSFMEDTLSKIGIERNGYGKGSVTAESGVIEHAEFIRNVDFLLEIGEKSQNYFPKVSDFFNGFKDLVKEQEIELKPN